MTPCFRYVLRLLPGFAPVVLALALAACSGLPSTPGAGSADADFRALGQKYLDGFPAFAPVDASALGDHRFDDRLDDVSEAGHAARAAFARDTLAALQRIDFRALSREERVDARLLENALQYALWRHDELQDWRWDPLRYTDLAGRGIESIFAREYAPLPVRVRAALARLGELPRLLAQERAVLDPARVPAVHATTAAAQNSGLFTLIEQRVVPALDALDDGERPAALRTLETARNALRQHQTWLEKKLLPEARGDFRLGAARYDRKLALALDTTLTRAQILAQARAALAATRAQMYALVRQVLAGRNNAPPLPEHPDHVAEGTAIFAALRLAAAEHPPREGIIDAATRALDDTRSFVAAHGLATLFDDPIEIAVMPEFQRGVAVAYCDPPGPLERARKTYYQVAPLPADWSDAQVSSFLQEYNTRALHELTIHEAMPGHYLQSMHAVRHGSRLRALLQSDSFVEGWAVYAERLMAEQGYMNGDPLMRLVQLKWYLRSIGNAILDQAVHVDGIERDAAMRFMMDETFQEEREAAGKWTRAQLSATQLANYFVGSQEHIALRAEAERRWGRAFTLRRYHDAVLSQGAPPVRYVRALLFDLPIE